MRSTMISALLASSVSIAAAQVNVEEWWWSYPPENYTTDYSDGYDPSFEICGGSCSDCREGAERCKSLAFSNICYEPEAGELCCEDYWGSACAEGYYCAYNATNAAVCCADGSTLDDCGKLFEEELTSTIGNDPTTVVVTQIRTADAEESNSQHKYTSLPGSPGHGDNGSSLSTGAKVGIAIGVFALCGLIVAAIAFFILRKRRNAKYAGLKGATQAPQPQYNDGNPVGGVGVFEPMRGPPGEMHPPDYKQQYMASPPKGVVEPYINQPPQQLGGMELNEMAGYDQEVHEMGPGSKRAR